MDESQRVARLCAQTGISESLAQTALLQTDHDMLEAVLWLEQTGQIPTVEGGSYSTASGKTRSVPGSGGAEAGAATENAAQKPGKNHRAVRKKLRELDWKTFFTLLWQVLFQDAWEIWRQDKRTVKIPLVLMIILLCVRFPVVLVALAVCLLFFGCRYRIAGPDFPGKDAINRFLDGAYALIHDLINDTRGSRKKQKK